jgi:dienelactone hydrolase
MRVPDKVLKALETARRKGAFYNIALLLVLVISFGAAFGYARDIGGDRVVAQLRGIPITVYTYRPKDCADPALLFVFHGVGRNASTYRDSARKLADRRCMIVFAPLFEKKRFPTWRYQRGGLVQDGKLLPKEQWAVSIVSDLVAWARAYEGKPQAPYYLFGHSAGAQYLSRVAAFHPPLDASQIVIANPSTYVLPSTKESAPYGLGGVFDQKESERLLKTYLELPITIYLGDDDTGDKNLSQTASARKQGANRLERGLSAFELAQSTAQAKGWVLRWRMVTAPGIGHTARGMLESDQATEAFTLNKKQTIQ